MKPTGLIRILLTSVFALLLAGGMMTAQAQQTVFVDKTNGSDGFTGGESDPFETIQRGLNEVSGGATGDRIIIRGGDYDESLTVAEAGLTFEVTERDDGVQNVEVTAFDFDPSAGETISIESTNGGFFTVAAAGGIELSTGTLDVDASSSLRLSSNSTVTREDGEITTAGPQFAANTNVIYAPTTDIDAGLELPDDLGNGDLSINGTNTVTFGSDLAVNNFSLANGASADFGSSSLSVGTGGVLVGASSTLTVGGALALEDTDVSLSVNGTYEGGDVSLSGVSTAGQVLVDGDGSVDVGTLTASRVTNDDGSDDNIQALIVTSSGTSDFSLDTVTTEPDSDNDETDGLAVDIDMNTLASSVSVGAGTFRDVLDNSNGALDIEGDVTLSGTFENNGGTIDIAAGATLNVQGTPSQNNSASVGSGDGVSGDGTIRFSGSAAQSVLPGGTLPNVVVDQALTLNGGGNSVNVNGSLAANSDVTITNTGGTATEIGSATIASGATVDANGDGVTVSGSLTNDGTLEADATGGTSLTVNGAFTTSGTATVNGDANFGSTFASSGTTDISGDVSVSGATFSVSDGTTTLVGTRTLDAESISFTGGTLDLTNDAVTLGGSFTRSDATNPTLVSGGASLTFVGSAEAGLNPGNSLRFEGDITINKPDITVTLGNDIRVDGTFTVEDVDVTPDFALDLGSNDIIMTEPGSVFDLKGNLTGTGRVVVENEGTIQGAGIYGNVAIADSDLGSGNNDITLGSDVEFSGTLSLINGGISTGTAPNTFDISPVGDSASVSRSVAGTATDITGGGTFNDAGNPYDLSYVGSGSATTASELSANVQDFTVASNAEVTLDKDAAPGGIVTVAGTLNEGGGPFTVTVGGDNASHSVSGIVNGEFIVDADTVSVAGSTSEDAASSIMEVTVNGAETSISDIKVIGQFATTTDASATVALIGDDDGDYQFQGNTVALPGDAQSIVNGVALDGSRFTLGSDITVQGGLAANSGAVELMEYDLTMDTGNFAGAADVSYTASSGVLVVDSGANLGTNGEAVPNVTVENVNQLSSDVSVSDALIVRDEIASNGNDFMFAGEATLDDVATAFSGSGSFIADSSAVTVVDQTAAVSNFEVDSDTTTVSVGVSEFSGSALDVTNTFTLTSGTFSHAASIVLTGDAGGDEFIYTDGAIERTGGEIELDNAAMTFDLAKDLTIPWLTVSNTADLDDEESLTVTGQLELDAQFLADDSDSDGQVVIGDGASILRTDGYEDNDVLDESPDFAGMYNLTYGDGSGQFTSGYELDGSAESVDVLTVNAADVYFEDNENIVSGDVTVNGTLDLALGDLDYGRQVVVADSATVQRSSGQLDDADNATADNDGDDPAALSAEGFYTLVYTGDNDVEASELEFLNTGNIALVTEVGDASVPMDYYVEIPFDRTVVNASIANTTDDSQTRLFNDDNDDGNFDVNDDTRATLTVTDTTSVTGGELFEGMLAAQGDLTIDNATVSSDIDAEANTTVTAGAINGDLMTAGNVSFDNNSTFGGGTNLTFDGSGTQNVQLAGGIAPANVTLAQQGDEPRVEVTGGNIAMGGLLTFDNGLLVTEGRLTLSGAGFNRANVEENEVGHVVGTVRQPVFQSFTGRIEYPVGTDTAAVDRESARYRPYTITFDQTDPAITATNIDVTHVDESPEGTVGLPFTDNSGVTIGNYPDFYWLVDATTSLGSQQSFDVEMQGDNLGLPFDDEEDLRIIRRFDGNADNNEYRLQGDPVDYDNILSVETLPNAPDDSTVVVRNIGSRGGIVTQGARFTIGVPSRAPAFTQTPGDTLNVAEDSTLTADFQAEGRDIGSEISFSLENAPDNASIASIPGHAATLSAAQSTVNESSPGSGSVSFGVSVEDDTIAAINYTVQLDGLDASAFSGAAGTANSDDDIIGMHVHGPAARGETAGILFGILGSQSAPFSPDTTNDADRMITADGQSITITGTWEPGEGANPNALLDQLLPAVGEDVPLYVNVHTTGNQGGEIRGQLFVQETARFTFTPDFDQAGTYDLATVVTDQTNGLTSRQPFTVVVDDNVPPFTLGSPSGDTTVTSIDASLVLQFVVGSTEFDLAAQNAADVSGDGQINSADASLILQFVARIIDEFPAAGNNAAIAAKSSTMGDVTGRIDWGELQHAKAEQAMNLPLVLSGDAKNVRSMQITAEFDPSTMSVADVTPALPSGWQVAHNVDRESGTIRIAMAGSRPVGPGQVGTLSFETNSDDAEAQLSGSFQLNAGMESTIGTTTVRSLPSDFALKANYPNPVRQSTTIEYDLPEETQVTLSVYNVLGQRVATLVNEKMSAGQHEVSFDASRLSSGMYIYRIQAGSFTKSNRMTIVK